MSVGGRASEVRLPVIFLKFFRKMYILDRFPEVFLNKSGYLSEDSQLATMLADCPPVGRQTSRVKLINLQNLRTTTNVIRRKTSRGKINLSSIQRGW